MTTQKVSLRSRKRREKQSPNYMRSKGHNQIFKFSDGREDMIYILIAPLLKVSKRYKNCIRIPKIFKKSGYNLNLEEPIK